MYLIKEVGIIKIHLEKLKEEKIKLVKLSWGF